MLLYMLGPESNEFEPIPDEALGQFFDHCVGPAALPPKIMTFCSVSLGV